MQSTSEFLSFVLYNDMKVLRRYGLKREHKFVAERMDKINQFNWCAKAPSLQKFAAMSIEEALELQFKTRTQVIDEYEISEYLAIKYIKLSKVLQLVCELELYGLYTLHKDGSFIPLDLAPRYLVRACANIDNKYWHTRLKNMMEMLLG